MNSIVPPTASAGSGTVVAQPVQPILPNDRWKPLEILFWLLPVVAYFVAPGYLLLMSQIMIVGLFALSLDLILGYAGIVSLGHAAFFGIGAYTAGLLAKHGWGEPFSGLLAAAAVAALGGYLVSFLVVRGHDLTRLMVTLGLGLMLFEAANKAAFVTGGVDGLSGMVVGKVLGVFAFDLSGKTAYLYSLVVLFISFVAIRRLVNSRFGLSLEGIREGGRRMPAIGADVNRRLQAIFTVGAAVAGIAGALLAQTTQFVGLDSLGFARSAELLIILVLGGTGRLYGALTGAIVFMVAQDYISGLNPAYWQFWIGLLLIVTVLFARGGILGGLERLAGLLPGKKSGRGRANSDITLDFAPGARHALIGPNGAGKTTFINLLTGAIAPSSGHVFLGEQDISGLPQHERVKSGMTRTFQINTLFPGLTVLESVMLAVCERDDRQRVWYQTVAQQKRQADEAMTLLSSLKLDRDAATVTRSLAYGRQRLVEIALALATRPRVLLLDEPAAGIPSGESAELFAVLSALPRDVTVLFIEHDMGLVFKFAERITVMVGGKVLCEGTPDEIASDPRVKEVYLGQAEHG